MFANGSRDRRSIQGEVMPKNKKNGAWCYWKGTLWVSVDYGRPTFKIINRISNYSKPIFNISPQTGNSLLRQISKTKSINQFLEQITKSAQRV